MLALLLGMAACATEEGYKKQVESWIGASEEQLVMQWGTPNGVYETGGSRFLTYTDVNDYVVPGSAPYVRTEVIGNQIITHTTPGSDPFPVHEDCATTFRITDGKVVDYSFKGNHCKQ
jgi:hypothetical protein